MASAKDKNKEVVAAPDFFNYSDYLPAGVTKDDGRTIGGFTPIYAPDTAWEEKFPPAGGYLCHFQILPAVKKGKDIYIPKMIKLIVKNAKGLPTKGVRGKGDGKEVVDVPVDNALLIPLTGNLLNNEELLDAVADPNNVHYALFYIRGQVDTGQITPMWDWHVQLFDKLTIKREGEYALPIDGSRIDRVLTEGKTPGNAEGRTVTGQTVTGQAYNTQTGEVAS